MGIQGVMFLLYFELFFGFVIVDNKQYDYYGCQKKGNSGNE